MSLFRERTASGFTVVRASGSDSPWAKKLAKQRRAVGRICRPAEVNARRKALNNGHGVRRIGGLGVYVDPEVMDIFVAEAKRRKMAKCALVGILMEAIADDDLFKALLDR